MNKIITATIAGALALGSSMTQAGGQFVDYAEVLNVKPMYRTITVNTPRQECWTEQVVHHEEAKNDVGGMILGGLIGGAVGNQFGRGQGKKASIAVGTLLGAGIGQSMSRNNNSGRSYVTNEQRCRTVNDTHQEERIEGYRVKYMYNGTVYHTRTKTDPGERMPVRVSVTPAN